MLLQKELCIVPLEITCSC